jgi:chlorophyll synthase
MIKSYLLHLRPKSFAVVAGHLAVGYALALPVAEWTSHWLKLIAAAGLWAIFLNGGTLAYNSAYDNDEGDIGYLDNPPKPPKYLWLFSLALMFAGGGLAFLVSRNFAYAYLACLAMSLMYSCPPLRLKARAGWDMLINVLGYGALTTFGGWASVSGEVSPFIIIICAGYAFLFGALYPLTQIYQYDEDKSRGDRTFAILLGPKWSLRFALFCALAAFGAFVWSVTLRDGAVIWLAPALAAWLMVLVPWIFRGRAYPEKQGMYRALWAWGLTDILVIVAIYSKTI